ncbi:MAG TPA: ATP-binding protein, partial [Opitutaceae bacterium]
VLDPSGPAIAAIRKGEAYYGVVDILGRSYISGYDPIRDAQGEVIGIYYVGYLVEALDQIGKNLSDTKLLQRGFVTLLDRKGTPLFYSKSADLSVLRSTAQPLKEGKTSWTDGEWQWRAEKFPQWQFTLLAAVNRNDIRQASWARVIQVFGFMTPLIVGALVLGFFFARRLAKALTESERLKEEAHKLSLVASRTYNGVLITGPTGKIEWANAAFTRITGYTLEEVLGRHPDSFLMGPDTSPATLAEKKKAREELRGFQLEILNYHKSGQPIWMLADGQPVLDEHGKVANYIVIMVEITKRKKAEEELVQAREAAEAASKTKSTFLANMSHELRTPMNAIIGYSEMLIEEAEDLGQEDFVPDLKKIHSAGKHLLGLINDVLDLSKIEAGKMTLYLEEIAVPGMIGEVVSTIQTLVEKNANQLVVQCPADFGVMRADVTKIRQTLFNLLSNAAKFTHNGKITLTVTTEQRDGRDMVAFRVADTGIGMTPAQLAKLFQAFVQADSSTTRKYGGTGLGLAISRKFCQIMGGDIVVASEQGKGTTFTAYIPRHVADLVATQPPFAAKAEAAPAPSAPAGATAAPLVPAAEGALVLVVDDDPTIVDILSRNLIREGYRVRSALNGRDALALARELQPRLVTLDVMMPSMDGWSVLTALKADPLTRA